MGPPCANASVNRGTWPAEALLGHKARALETGPHGVMRVRSSESVLTHTLDPQGDRFERHCRPTGCHVPTRARL